MDENKIIHAEDKFGAQTPPPCFPEYTMEDLVALGITLLETEEHRTIEVSFAAQKKLVEAAQMFGFGARKALDKLMGGMLEKFGFSGQVQFHADEKTFAWSAWQSKVQPTPKDDAAPAQEPSNSGSGEAERGREDVQFASGAVRDANVAGSKTAKYSARYDLISAIGLRRLAETYGEGAMKYTDHNWRKGMPVSVMINHAMAHITSYLTGDASEDHMAHAAWNLFAVMHFEETRPDLFDLKVDDYQTNIERTYLK